MRKVKKMIPTALVALLALLGGHAALAQEVDTTPPETFMHSPLDPGATTSNTTQSFSFSSNEPGSTFECRLIGRSEVWEPCNPGDDSITYTDLAEGSYTFEVRAIDPAGNVDPTPATRSFTIDTTAPTIAITNVEQVADTVTFTFEGQGDVAAFQCELAVADPNVPGDWDTIRQGPCTSPVSYSGLADGQYYFRVRAFDAAGNQTFVDHYFSVRTPQTRKECKARGWQTFGFGSQGECITFVKSR
jgi:predicted phage tail protein